MARNSKNTEKIFSLRLLTDSDLCRFDLPRQNNSTNIKIRDGAK